MSGFLVGFDARSNGHVLLPPPALEELRSCPYDSWGKRDGAGFALAQAWRHYSETDKAPVPPVQSHGRWWVGDLRLDNGPELREQLGCDSSLSDVETVLKAWDRWGPVETPRRLLGDFAFVVVETEGHVMHAVRDPFGVRPLYVTTTDGLLFVAGQIGTLVAHPQFVPTPDDEVVAEWLLAGRVWNRRHTFYRDIAKLPPATVTTWSGRTSPREQTYWQPPSGLRRLDRVPELLAEEFDRAVTRRVPVDGPVAAHNSGGLDSGPIAALAARQARRRGFRLVSYNWARPVYEGHEAVEWDVARELAIREGMDHLEVGLAVGEFVRTFREHDICIHGTTSFEYEYSVAADAQRRGVSQILSGFGGDEFVTEHGADDFVASVLRGRWDIVRAMLVSNPSTPPPASRLAWRAGRTFIQDLRARVWGPRSIRARLRDNTDYAATLLAARARGIDHRNLDSRALGLVARAGRVDVRHRRQLELGYHQERLETWAAIGRRHGLRYVYPMLDRRLVELVFLLPSSAYGVGSRRLWLSAIDTINPPISPLATKDSDQARLSQVTTVAHHALSEWAKSRPEPDELGVEVRAQLRLVSDSLERMSALIAQVRLSESELPSSD